MSMNALKVSVAVIVFGLAVACSKDEPAADAGPAPAASEIAAPAVAESTTTTTATGSLTLSDYADTVVPPVGGNCALDAINGAAAAGATATVGSDVLFGGWLADASNLVPADARLVLTGPQKSYSVPLTAGVERLDVAASLQAETLKLSGFNVLAKLDVVPDTYALSIVHGSAAAAASCSLNASLVVSN